MSDMFKSPTRREKDIPMPPAPARSDGLTELRRLVRTADADARLGASIAHNIRKRREELGLTQQQLANLMKKKQPHIARLERSSYGRHTIHSLNQIAVALETTVSRLTEVL